jgi:hypothetical protein
MDRAFSTLAPKVATSVPGCPQPMILDYIRDAAIRVCERTLLWRHVQPKFTLTAGVPEYPFERPQYTDVHVLLAATLNDRQLELLTMEQALGKYPEWADLFGGMSLPDVWANSPSGSFNSFGANEGLFNESPNVNLATARFESGSEPRTLTQVTPDRFLVMPFPDDARDYDLRMFYALKPSRTATAIPRALFDELEDAILHTALQHLLVMPGVEWNDRELATYHARQALLEIAGRRARANLGFARGSLTASAPRFA